MAPRTACSRKTDLTVAASITGGGARLLRLMRAVRLKRSAPDGVFERGVLEQA